MFFPLFRRERDRKRLVRQVTDREVNYIGPDAVRWVCEIKWITEKSSMHADADAGAGKPAVARTYVASPRRQWRLLLRSSVSEYLDSGGCHHVRKHKWTPTTCIAVYKSSHKLNSLYKCGNAVRRQTTEEEGNNHIRKQRI